MPPASGRWARTTSVSGITLSQLRRYVVARQGYDTPAARNCGRRRRQRCAAFRASSWTRSRPSTAATGSRSGRVSATTRGRPCRGLLAEGRIFEYWAHEACLLPIEDYACTGGGWSSTATSIRGSATSSSATPACGSRSSSASARRGRSGRATSRARAAAGCGTGSRRRRCSRRSTRRGELAIAGARRVPAAARPARARMIPRNLDAPVPTEEEFRRGSRSRRPCRGALTERGIAEHCRFRGSGRRPAARGRARARRARAPRRGRGRRRPPSSSRPTQSSTVGAERRRPALAVRQPRLGPRLPRARVRLPPRDRGLQARITSACTATTCCPSSTATDSSAAPISRPTVPSRR